MLKVIIFLSILEVMLELNMFNFYFSIFIITIIMDLTLFIMIVLLIISILYGISILKNLKNDLKKINGSSLNENDNSDMKEFIDTIKNGLEYLKKFL